VSADRAAIDRAIAAVYPSLVRISVVALQWSGGRELRLEASGSGTIVSADGFVVTNHHVAGRVQRIVCTLPSNEEVPAELIGTDPLSDIAVLKLKPGKPRTFPVARFGTSSTLRVGDVVLAMGSPLALSQSVTRGIVSNKDMTMPVAYGSPLGLLDGEDVGSIVKWIGHDAAIYPGNSGGPLVNLAGEIVGVNEISFGLGGAIPADLAKSVFESLKRDGRVRRSWTGVEVQPRVGEMNDPGALVSWVAENSPAEAGGVKTGDLLVKINDSPIDVKFAEQLPAVNQLLFGLAIGKPARLVVRRDGKEITVSVTPMERPVASSLPDGARALGRRGREHLGLGGARDGPRDDRRRARRQRASGRSVGTGEAAHRARRHHRRGGWTAGALARRPRVAHEDGARIEAEGECARGIRPRSRAAADCRGRRRAASGSAEPGSEQGVGAGERPGAHDDPG
jgi:serine protease Do